MLQQNLVLSPHIGTSHIVAQQACSKFCYIDAHSPWCWEKWCGSHVWTRCLSREQIPNKWAPKLLQCTHKFPPTSVHAYDAANFLILTQIIRSRKSYLLYHVWLHWLTTPVKCMHHQSRSLLWTTKTAIWDLWADLLFAVLWWSKVYSNASFGSFMGTNLSPIRDFLVGIMNVWKGIEGSL